MSAINICYAPNENYAGLTAVSMVSVLKNAGSNDDIRFIIMYSKGNLSKKSLLGINKVKEIRDCEIKYIEIDPDEFSDFPTVNWITTEAWYRVKIPQLCSECEKVLYLDCDTIVLNSLDSLFKTDLNCKLVGVVCKNYKGYLNLKDNLYFNSGVILFNIKECLKQDLYGAVRRYVKANKNNIRCADQDVLNAVTDGGKFCLDAEYNYCEGYFRHLEYKTMDNPKIVHFVGPNPNRFDCRNSFRYKWQEYVKLTLFYDDFIEKNIYNMIRLYPKLKFDELKFSILSKIMFGKLKQRYITKSIIHKNLMDGFKF